MPDNSFGSAEVALYPMTGGGDITIPHIIVFQCAPLEEFGYQVEHEHTNYMTISGGEFSRDYGRKLRTASFETIVTAYDESWGAMPVNPYNDAPVQFSALEFVLTLRGFCNEGKTFRLVVSKPGGHELLRMNATLRGMRITEKAGEPDTKYLSLDFVEYRSPVLTDEKRGDRPVGAKSPHTLAMRYDRKKKRWQITVTAPKNAAARPRIAKMVKGKKVTLAKIAVAIYGKDGRSKTKTILKANPELGKTWGRDTPLEKNKWFKSGKKRVFNVPAEPK